MNEKDIISYQSMAKLELSEEERKLFSDIADKLASDFEKASAIDTNGVEPLVSVLNLKNILREDVSKQIISREKLLENAPESFDGYFQVPKTLE